MATGPRPQDGAGWREYAAEAGSIASTLTQFAVALSALIGLLKGVAEDGAEISDAVAAKLLATLDLCEGPIETAHRYVLKYQQIFFTLAAEADRKADASGGPRAVSRFPARGAE